MNNKIIQSVKCELCKCKVINWTMYKIGNKYICKSCYNELKTVIIRNGKEVNDGEFIDFVKG